MVQSADSPETMPNLAKVQSIIWWILSAVMISGIFLPFLLGIDAEQWGFGIAFLCLVFGITGVIVAVMYTRRASLVSRMLKHENLLAHWKYDPVEWQRYAREEHEVNKSEKRKLFLLILIITIAVGLILTISRPDGALAYIFSILGIILVIGLAAFFSVLLRYRQNRKYLGEAFISSEGVYLNRELHVWRGMGANLEEVVFQERQRTQPLLTITYSIPNRYNRQKVTVRIPVPKGGEEAAQKVAEILLKQLKDIPIRPQ